MDIFDLKENLPFERDVQGDIERIRRSFETISADYGIEIHIKDFLGCFATRPSFKPMCDFFLWHDSPFCSYVKIDPRAAETCVTLSNEYLRRRCIREPDGFFGTCFCGISEYVIPVKYRTTVIGAVLLGEFGIASDSADRRFARLERIYGFSGEMLGEAYEKSTRSVPKNMDAILTVVKSVVLAFELVAEKYIDKKLVDRLATEKRIRRGDIVGCAAEYIRRHYAENLCVSEIAKACLCSPSALNHSFKATLGKGIPEYINHYRVTHALSLLSKTDDSIEAIAAECGFSSSGYFIRVFRHVTKATPKEYRNRHAAEKQETAKNQK